MKILTYIGLVVGLAVVVILVAWQGVGSVATILASLGWGILLLPVAWFPHLFLAASSWAMLFLPGHGPRLPVAIRAMWMGRSVNALLPVASIGGEVVKARLLALNDTKAVDAGASVVVDKTVQALSLLLWSLIGVAALVALRADDELVAAALGGAALLAAGIAGFIVVQRAGTFGFLARSAAKVTGAASWDSIVESAGELDTILRALYGRQGRIVLSCLVRLAARSALTVELMLVAYLMGHPLTLLEALMLKSLTGALRGAAFMVPGGLGVQEGGFVVLGALVGLPPEFTLSLSLATRGRELIVGVPGLLAWQHIEGRTLIRRLSPQARRGP
jgi:putative membrane protein